MPTLDMNPLPFLQTLGAATQWWLEVVSLIPAVKFCSWLVHLPADTVRAASTCIVWSIVSTRVPARQAAQRVSQSFIGFIAMCLPMTRAESQFQVRFRLAHFRLAPCRLFAIRPWNAFAARI